MSETYNKWIQEETKKTTEEFLVASVGKMNPKQHLARETEESLNENVLNSLGTMLSTVVFWSAQDFKYCIIISPLCTEIILTAA